MTNTNNSNIQWEVAGARKKGKETDAHAKNLNGKTSKDLTSKIPRLEALQPIKLDPSIFDLIRESDDEEENKNSNKAKQKKKQAGSTANTSNSSNPPVSPKQPPRKPNQEPINLLASSMLSNQKKKTTTLIPGKKLENELDNAIAELNLEDFKQKYLQLESLFPDNLGLIIKHLASFLNQSLNNVPELEPLFNHENESNFYPLSKLDNKLEKFFNNLITKLKRADSESVFEYCFDLLFSENPKIQSNHGIRIFIQILLKHTPNLIINNLSKYNETANLHRHRHQRILLALWSFSQVGYFNLNYGIKIWFDSMLPLITTKNASNYVATYLSSIFNHHKIESKLTQLSGQSLISLDNYLKYYELINDKTLVLNKEASQKFKSSFQHIRTLFIHGLDNDSENKFEKLLADLPTENNSKQEEYLEILLKILFLNRNSVLRWRKIYLKFLPQSLVLLEHLAGSHSKKLKNLKDMRETLLEFNEQTSAQLAQLASSNKESNKPYYFKKVQKSSTLENDRLKRFNKLVQQLINQHFQRASLLKIMFRTFLIISIAAGLFFYWDVKQNKSIYVNSIKKELAKYGLLDQTVKLIETIKTFLLNVQSMIYYYVPKWYKKASDTILPYTKSGWNLTKEYSLLAYKNTEPYRKLAINYYFQAVEYIQKNFPIFVKNLISVVELIINYAITVINFIMFYTNQVFDFIGIQLLGFKKGEFEKIFIDGFKVFLEYLTSAVQWLNKNLIQE